MGHIIEPGTQMFTCPEGHYWFQQADRAMNAPPYQPDQPVLCDFKHAPCPTTRQEALGILYVLEAAHPDDEQLYWPGYTVAEPEALADLTAEDRAAWDAWVASDRTVEFLDQVIAKCKAQAEANKKSHGYMVIRERATDEQSPEVLARHVASKHGAEMAQEGLLLEHQLMTGYALDNESERRRIFNRLEELLGEIDAVVDDPAPTAPEVWHARGIVTRLLLRPIVAERAFLEAARNAPFELSPWLELTRVRAEQGKLALAEEAARKAVGINNQSAPAWANLAAVLMEMDSPQDALAAAEKALAIDPADVVAQNVMKRCGGRS
jgi:tetratricopeptide (TPR) repeat protein